MGLFLRNIRLVEAPGPWPVHVLGPGERTLVGATVGREALTKDGLSEKTVGALNRGALRLYDFMLDPVRGVDLDSAPATIVGAAKAYLRAQGLQSKRSSNNPWWDVTGPDHVLARVKTEFAGARRHFQAMIDEGVYAFDHPLELGVEQMRQLRLRAAATGTHRRSKAAFLSAALFRFGIVAYKPPPQTQVELIRGAVDAAQAAGWWEGRVVYLSILHDGAPRPGEPPRFTMLDWYRASRCGDLIWSTSKGFGDTRVKKVQVRAVTGDRLRAFVNGPRRQARAGALSVAEYVALGDAGEFERLAAEPLLVEADGRPLVYDRLARAFRRDIADNVVDPGTGLRPVRRPTLHWFRHLFCYDHLGLIYAAKLKPEEELLRKQQLVAYMHWSTGLVMLDTYGRQFEQERLASALASSMLRRQQMADAIASGTHSLVTAPSPAGSSQVINAMFRDRRADSAAKTTAPGFARRPPPRR